MNNRPTEITHQPEIAVSALPVLKALLAAWQAAAIYEENNQAYRARRRELIEALEALFAETGNCRIVCQRGYFFVNDNRLNYDHAFSFGKALGTKFSALDLGTLAIAPEATPGAIDQAIFALAHADTRKDDPFEALSAAWADIGIDGIEIGRKEDVVPDDGETNTETDVEVVRKRRARAIFGRAESVVQEMWRRVRDRNSFDASNTQRVVHQLVDQIAHDEEILLEFTALKEFDEYTYYHSVNVAIYSIAVGMRLGFDRERLSRLGMAALFHDIGKVKLPRDLITKPEEFNEEDWVEIKRHPALGALTIANLRQIDDQVSAAMAGAFEHHLRMNMTGYPALSAPRRLHLFSRIIMLCDAFDAMTSGRVYQKDRISPDEAVRRLIHKGLEWFDPVVLKAFIHVLGVFPVGTVGRLSDGSLAVVVRNNPDDLYAPDILIVREPGGAPCRRSVCLSTKDEDGPASALHFDEIIDPEAEGIRVADYIGIVSNGSETVNAVEDGVADNGPLS